nr:hypothetical protein [Tanacetum cinerariifolium]
LPRKPVRPRLPRRRAGAPAVAGRRHPQVWPHPGSRRAAGAGPAQRDEPAQHAPRFCSLQGPRAPAAHGYSALSPLRVHTYHHP